MMICFIANMIKKRKSLKRIGLAAFCMWLALAIACNLPRRQTPQCISAQQLKQTLEALSTTALGATPGTPAPGMVQPTPGGPYPGINTPISGNLPTSSPAQAGLFPDSEIIYSPTSIDFDVQAYVANSGGYLSTYQETLRGKWLSGADDIIRVAQENSINPRLLLALLEYRAHWVTDPSESTGDPLHPLGFNAPNVQGLYAELILAAKELNTAYYGWRAGSLTSLRLKDQTNVSLSPELNAGTVAVQYIFSKFYGQDAWAAAINGQNNFIVLYARMFGDPWARAAVVEPLFPPGLSQPAVELPFAPGERWSFTGGPHLSWNSGTPNGAIDFAPITGEPACQVSRAWVTAPAAGVIVRSGENAVALDLDGDGFEQTGWVFIFLHIADPERIPVGSPVNLGDRLGHPSCERGNSTGTNVHIARKFNGEWLAADASPAEQLDRQIPFVMSGWTVKMGNKIYQGKLVKGAEVVTANPAGPKTSVISR